MELFYRGPCGLRNRIQLVAAHQWDYEQIAEFLDVPAEVVRLVLIDDAYTPSDEYQETMWENLALLAPDVPWPDPIGPVGVARQWQVWRSPLWDDAQMGSVTFPGGSVEFYWVFCGGSAGSGVSTSDPFDPYSVEPIDAALDTLGNDDLTRLLTLRVKIIVPGA